MQTSAHQTPWPGQIRGVETGHMDPDTWDWLQRLRAPGKTPVFQGQTFLVTGGASGIGEKLCVFMDIIYLIYKARTGALSTGFIWNIRMLFSIRMLGGRHPRKDRLSWKFRLQRKASPLQNIWIRAIQWAFNLPPGGWRQALLIWRCPLIEENTASVYIMSVACIFLNRTD
jgi:hypothetical protein